MSDGQGVLPGAAMINKSSQGLVILEDFLFCERLKKNVFILTDKKVTTEKLPSTQLETVPSVCDMVIL